MIRFDKNVASGGSIPDDIALVGRLSERGWVPPETMSFSECGAELRALRRRHYGVLFGIGDLLNYAELKWGETYAQLASDSGYNPQFLMNCKWVSAKFPVHERVSGLSFSHHQVVAGLPMEQARALLTVAGAEGWSKEDLRQTVKELRSQGVAKHGQSHSGIRNDGSRSVESNAEAVVAHAFGTSGRFPVLLAVPRWQESISSERAQAEQTETAELYQLPISDIAFDDAVLFMWVPSGKILDALQVITAWGFEYRAELVWVNDKPRPGSHAQVLHELLLIAERGEMPAPPSKMRPISLIESPRNGREKLDYFYRIIDTMYPELQKIELFPGAYSNRPKAWAVLDDQELSDPTAVTEQVTGATNCTL